MHKVKHYLFHKNTEKVDINVHTLQKGVIIKDCHTRAFIHIRFLTGLFQLNYFKSYEVLGSTSTNRVERLQ